MLKKTTLIATLFSLTLGAAAVHADMVTLNETTQGGGNKGLSFRPWTDASHTTTADFVMTARTGIDDSAPLIPDATGLAGTIYIDKDGKGNSGKLKGAGVQTATGGGSKGISGSGGDRDEELIFTYDQPVYVSAITIRLGDIDFGNGVCDKDDPVIFLQTTGSPVFDVVISEADIVSAFNYIGDPKDKNGEVSFNSFMSSAGLVNDASLTAFGIRETKGHLYVNGVSGGNGNVVVPEPATMALLACGSVIMVRRRRRGRA